MLFVPAARWSMIVKAAASAADAVCIDLEDSVPASEKEASRANVVRAFTELEFGKRARMVRINGLDTSFAYRDLIDVIEPAGEKIDLVMVPKVGSPADVRVRRDTARADRARIAASLDPSASKHRSRARPAFSSGSARSRKLRRDWKR